MKYKDEYTLKEFYEYFDYKIYPKEGKIISKLTGHEIGKNRPRVVLECNKRNRANLQKIRVIYEIVFYGPHRPGYILRPKDGNYANAAIDNIQLIARKDYFKEHDWSSLAVLSKEQVDSIKEEYETGEYSNMELALKYNCSKSTIQKVIGGTYYHDLKSIKKEDLNSKAI